VPLALERQIDVIGPKRLALPMVLPFVNCI
jgi:hypothetical protein